MKDAIVRLGLASVVQNVGVESVVSALLKARANRFVLTVPILKRG